MLAQRFFKSLLLSWILAVAISVGIYFEISEYVAKSFFFGSMVAIVNTGLFAYLWHLHFDKKDVAQFAVVIVIKYAILMLIIYYTLILGGVSLEATGAGLIVAMLIISVGAALTLKTKKLEHNTNASPL